VPDAPRPPCAAPGGAGLDELEIVVKTTNRCNASCAYCSAGVNAGGPRSSIDLELARRVCAEAAGLVERGAYRAVHVLWHGGEPLVLGKGFFRALLPHARTDVLSHQLQTNLLALDEEWLEILEPLVGRDGVGTSCDPASGERRFAGGSYLDTWLEKMALLRRHGWRVGCVYVLHRNGLDAPEDVYWFFRNLGSDGSVSLAVNPILPVGDARAEGASALLLAPGELAAFLRRLARVWAADGFRLRVRPLDAWMEWLRGESPRLPCNLGGPAACERGRCGITPEGEVFGCGRAADAGAPSLGSVRASPLAAVLGARATGRPLERDDALRRGECGTCSRWAVCHGGCPHERVFGDASARERTAFCRDVKETLDFLETLRAPRPPDERRRRRRIRRSVAGPERVSAPADGDAAALEAVCAVAAGSPLEVELPEALVEDYRRAASRHPRPPRVAAVRVEEATEATAARLAALRQLVRPVVRVTRPQDAGAVRVLARLLELGYCVSLDDLSGWDPGALEATASLEERHAGRETLDPWSAMVDYVATGSRDLTLARALGRTAGDGLPQGRCLRCAAWKFCRGHVARSGADDRTCDVVLRAFAARAGLPSPGATP
jgi:uncharacterized protein